MKLFADTLTEEIGKSFAKSKKKYNTTEVHHIVARTAWRAKPAKYILEKSDVDIKINSTCNLVTLKKGLHKRLHRKSYFDMVNGAIKAAYDEKGNKRKNVKEALSRLKTYLKKLNKAAPY